MEGPSRSRCEEGRRAMAPSRGTDDRLSGVCWRWGLTGLRGEVGFRLWKTGETGAEGRDTFEDTLGLRSMVPMAGAGRRLASGGGDDFRKPLGGPWVVKAGDPRLASASPGLRSASLGIRKDLPFPLGEHDVVRQSRSMADVRGRTSTSRTSAFPNCSTVPATRDMSSRTFS